ncbi:hypothetical protein NFI96_000182 [Prochilodus magdalenae]|nr:hypothetical protein NFI96_000182 [Prochilodus magdalenae]
MNSLSKKEVSWQSGSKVIDPGHLYLPNSTAIQECVVAHQIRIQMEEPVGELVPRSLLSRLKSSYICRNVIGALMLGLVAGLSAGGCMGAMAAVMVRLIRDIKINQIELMVKISNDPDYPSISTAHLTYLCLLVAISSSAVGVLCGHQAFNLVRRQRGGDTPGKALALAAPVAVLGVAVTGAALGTGLEVLLLNLVTFTFLPNSTAIKECLVAPQVCMAEIRVQMEEPAGELVPRSLLSRLKSSYICRNVVGALMLGLVAGLSAGGCMGAMAAVMVRLIRDIKINQTELMVKISNDPDYPSISTAHLTYLCLLVAISSSAVGVLCGHQAFNLIRRQRGGDMLGKALALAAPVAVLGVAVTGAALGAGLEVILSSVASFIFSHGFSRSLLHNTDHPVPLLEPAEFTPPVVYALERIFVIVFGVQMIQVSCGADLFSYFVTGGAGKVGVGAVAATAGVLAALSGISSMLGTGASLGVLLAVSGGAGVALDAAGDLGHRYGGHAEEETPLILAADEVRRALMRVSTRKAAGPDGIPGRVLKACASQLASTFTDIFNLSLAQSTVPVCFKTTTIIPIPKKSTITSMNDYRPIALTPIVMKCFERLILSHIKRSLPSTLDPHQFAYRANRSTDDAVSLAIHTALNHLDSNNSYVRMLFIDFSSAFNTIIPSRLIHKLSTLGISSTLCSWIMDFLSCRPQCVRMGEHTSPSLTLSTGCPQGIVLSPLLYTLYTHDCTTTYSSNTIIKFADDTTIIGNITNDDEGPYREEVKLLTEWCAANNLSLNVSKTKELIIDFRKGGRTHTPLNIGGTLVEESSFKFLGVHLAQDLTWTTNTSHLVRKAQQRLHFLRRLRRVNLPQQLLCNFYRSTVESILTSCITVWYGSATSAERKALQRVVKTAQHITASTLPPIQDIYDKRCLRKAAHISSDPTHPSHPLFQPLPSGKRSRVKSSSICNTFGALGLALVSGGCMGAVSAEMACLLRDATQRQTELSVKVPDLYPFVTSSYVTYMSLLGGILSSAAGLLAGWQAYSVVKGQRWGMAPGRAPALAASVAVLGAAVTGAAVGATLEMLFSSFILEGFSVDSGATFLSWHMLASTVLSIVLGASSGFFYGGLCVVVSFMMCLLMYSERLMVILFFDTESVLFLDLGSMLPLLPPSLLLGLLHEFHLSKKPVMVPCVMVMAVLVARSCIRDKDRPVPLLDPAGFTVPALLVLERFFVLVLGVHMFQASLGAVLFSWLATGGAGDFCTGALAAAYGVLATLASISSRLGTGASLGALLAASGGAGVALKAAGDLGQRCTGQVGRAGAVVGAAVGALLPLAAQDVKFGVMVALCAAAIPASPYIVFCWSIAKSTEKELDFRN